MNEELQSTNEELQTVNDELRQRGDDLRDANTLLETILTSVRSSVIVLDRELRVIAWNRRSEDLWGARAEEVRGQNFFNLDIGLPMDQLPLGDSFVPGRRGESQRVRRHRDQSPRQADRVPRQRIAAGRQQPRSTRCDSDDR